MTRNKKGFNKTPAEFYREIRPEYFSDSETLYRVKLPKEHFDFVLNQISTNQKQDDFERLCRKLAELFISPNLIPQVGPTGGGDGKTDTDTYPVSEVISEKWYIPEQGWEKDEKWAFAISAKKDWKLKVISDTKSIISTKRGYTKIFFFTNQHVSSKKKKDTQDSIQKEYGVELTIFDAAWIIEKIYDNNLIDLVVDTLNLSDVYKDETLKLGPNDTTRIKRLEEIELKINNTNRYLEYDYQLVEDALESAILTRMIEKPKDEVFGKFDRALRLARKLNNSHQLSRIHYQKAWTHINWYDDFEGFVSEFKLFKDFTLQDFNSNGIELYFNLLNLLSAVASRDGVSLKISCNDERAEFCSTLEKCAKDSTKPTTALIARTYLAFIDVSNCLVAKKDVTIALNDLQTHFQESKKFVEYPFENFKKMLEVYGEILPNNAAYDILINHVAQISEERASARTSGEVFLKRGIQKLDKGYHKESIVYFGKSLRKLANEESHDQLYFALIGLYHAYRSQGLLWASNNCILAASSLMIKEWHDKGKLNRRFYKSIQEALKNELLLGRIPHILIWHELFRIIQPQFEEKTPKQDQIPFPELVDATLAVRLLNGPYESWKTLSIFPDLFENEKLWLSQDTALYMLGFTQEIEKPYLDNIKTIKTIDDYFTALANQPFKEQIFYETNLLAREDVEFKSIILGSEFVINFTKDTRLSVLAETLLAFFESFFATSLSEVYSSFEQIGFNLRVEPEIESYVITQKQNNLYDIEFNFEHDDLSQITHKLLLDLLTEILTRNFTIKDSEAFIKQQFEQDEVVERQVFIVEHYKFIERVLGQSPKMFLNDWIEKRGFKEYHFKRENNAIQITNESTIEKELENNDLKNVKHHQTKVLSIIDPALWESAGWKGFGFAASEEIPFGVFLGFQNIEFGRQIFIDWIKRFGRSDQNEEINISVITGVNKENPFWYRVHVNKRFDKGDLSRGRFMITTSRMHEMNAQNDINIQNLIKGLTYYKKYSLFPALINPDYSVEPHLDLGIEKKSLIIRNAWEIGENDPDSAVIWKGDNPVIPLGQKDAPVISLLKKKNS